MFSEHHIEMLQSVNAKRPGLVPWQGLQDITAQVTYQFVKGFSARTLEGKTRTRTKVRVARAYYGGV